MGNEDQYEEILQLLRENVMTTMEIDYILSLRGIKCPDDLARKLNIMRRKGLIKGAPSPEKGAWVWWVEE